MARRRRSNQPLSKIEVTYLKDNSKETMRLVGESTTGKSIKVIRENGDVDYIAKSKISYTEL